MLPGRPRASSSSRRPWATSPSSSGWRGSSTVVAAASRRRWKPLKITALGRCTSPPETSRRKCASTWSRMSGWMWMPLTYALLVKMETWILSATFLITVPIQIMSTKQGLLLSMRLPKKCNKILGSFCSPLMLAIHSRSVKCVNLLLEAGADVKGMRTTTPLQSAAMGGLTDVLKPLLDAGADPDVRDEFGLLPIQLAAYFGTRKDVEILFEVTSSRIPAVHDWSVDGIISYTAKSEPKLEDHPLSKMSVAKLKEEGDKAMHKEDYNAALEFYTMAMVIDPDNADSTLMGNRGFCRLLLGNGEGALNDALFCRTVRPDCADSCWLLGYSYVQLKVYEKACDAFLDGLKLKPGFVGIEKALREALRLLKESHADKKNGSEGLS
ncbi:uncharacterized protein [Lolium perenne]|uniref:uncharacterized protein isoform X5 n=1 Tax=Lolium perenne TaxID=4522 RepID=UPI003A99F81B